MPGKEGTLLSPHSPAQSALDQYRPSCLSWRVERQEVGQNTVAFYLRTLRTLYNKAVEAGQAPPNDIFAHVQTSNVRTAKRAITIKEIRKIEKLNLPIGSFLDKARDLFFISFYLRGMAFVDMVGLKIPLTTYVARHTWASVALHMNIPIATISEGMGHSSYKTTQIYLQSLDVATINEANERIIRKIRLNEGNEN